MKANELMKHFLEYVKAHKYIVTGVAAAVVISGGIIIYQIAQPQQPTKDKEKVAVIEKKDKEKNTEKKSEKKADEKKPETKKEEAKEEVKSEPKTEAKSERKTESKSESKKQESTSKPSSSSTSTSSKPSKPKCHTETITIPEQGHNERYLISDAVYEDRPVYRTEIHTFSRDTGEDITGRAEAYMAALDWQYYQEGKETHGSYEKPVQVQVGTEPVKVKEAVYGERWVVDQPAHTETKRVCE